MNIVALVYCVSCKTDLPFDSFPSSELSGKRGEGRGKCRSCWRSTMQKWRDKDPNHAKDLACEKRRRHYKKHRETILARVKADHVKNRDRDNARRRDWHDSLRSRVYDHYGRACVCCGETEPTFLTIDHINNDGNVCRRVNKHTGGTATYKWIIRNGFPPDLQTLCRNCNWAKHANGGICPHQEKKAA